MASAVSDCQQCSLPRQVIFQRYFSENRETNFINLGGQFSALLSPLIFRKVYLVTAGYLAPLQF